MTVKSFTHLTEQGFEEATFEMNLPWYDFWSDPYLRFTRHPGGMWCYAGTNKTLSDSHTVLLAAYLVC